MRTLFLLLLAAQFAFSQSAVNGSFTHGGLARTYILYVPASYSPTQPAPLILNLHGYTSDNQQQLLYSNFTPIADTAGFLMVYPNGTLDQSGNRYWNVGFSFTPNNVDDVGFLNALIDTIAAHYNVNPQRVYSTGMSNGGFMSYVMACQSPKIAAIASVTGSMTTATMQQCQPNRPVPVMQIHGTADPTVPYGGLTGFLSIDSVVSYWVNANNCNPAAQMTNVPNTNLTDGTTAERYVYGGGTNGAEVELYKVLNGAHTWPGAPFVIGVTCMDFSASKEIWRFFNQHKLSALNPQSPSHFNLYPNPANTYLTLDLANQDLPLTLRLYDLHGRQLRLWQLEDTHNRLDMSEIGTGLYLMEMQTKAWREVRKLWVE